MVSLFVASWGSLGLFGIGAWGILTVTALRCRSLQGGPRPGFDGQAPYRDYFPRLRPPVEVLAKSVPVQAAEEGGSGSYGDTHQAVKRPSSVSRPGPPALG